MKDDDAPVLTKKVKAKLMPLAKAFPDLAEHATQRKVGRPKKMIHKVPITMRVDPDVAAWLKEGGPGYQTRANKILRREMEKHPGK